MQYINYGFGFIGFPFEMWPRCSFYVRLLKSLFIQLLNIAIEVSFTLENSAVDFQK